MPTLHRIALLCLPVSFLLAGSGMLWLYVVESAPGTFFQQLASQESTWLGAHVVLVFSCVLMLPAALAMRSAIRGRICAGVASVMVCLVAPTATLLAGQYAIDFAVAMMVRVGGDALTAHGLLFDEPLINVLFYGLPNLLFLALLVESVALVCDKALPRWPSVALMLLWTAVLLGNLVHPLFQRSAILLLTIAYLPVVSRYWSGRHTLI
jgi:hypothetical protein